VIVENCVLLGVQNLCDSEDERIFFWSFGKYFQSVESTTIRSLVSCFVAVMHAYMTLFDETNNLILAAFASILMYIVGVEAAFYLKNRNDFTLNEVKV
jgi:hypothetical protein